MRRSIYHFYGVTPQFYGIPSDNDYALMNSIETHFWNYMLNRLAEEENTVSEAHLFSQADQAHEVVQGALTIRFFPRFKAVIGGRILERFFGKMSLAYNRFLKEHHPELFVFYCGIVYTYWPLLRYLVKEKIPYAIHFHGGDLKKYKTFRKHFYNKARVVIAPTETDRQAIIREYAMDPAKVAVIPCGISTQAYAPATQGTESGYPRLCFSGILIDRKSFKETLQCLDVLRKEFPDVVLEVAGEYRFEPYKREAEALIDRLNLRKHLKFLGWLKQDELRAMYSRCDLLFFPSKVEPLGRSLLEAMACSTPAICLRTATGPAEIIRHGENGILTSLDKLSEDALSLLGDRAMLEQMSARARDTVIERYSFESSYQKARETYLKCLNGSVS